MERKEELRRNSINVHQRLGTDTPITSEQMDTERINTRAYDYLCRLEEAKSWISEITETPSSYEEFEEEMRKGIYLAQVAKFYSPESVKSIFVDEKLQYRHTDNINFFIQSLIRLGLPRHFFFEVIDLYEKKNFPKVVYCVHGLAHYLNVKGKTLGIVSAAGKIFSKGDMDRIDDELSGVKMPSFESIKEDLEKDDLEYMRRKIRAELLEEEEEEEESQKEIIQEETLQEHSDTSTSISDRICLKLKTWLYYKSFDDIYYKKNVSLFSIRRFLFIFFKDSLEMVKERKIDEYHEMINLKLKDIYTKEVYLEDIEHRIRLILENKLDIHNIKYTEAYTDIDLKPIQEVLQVLQTSPENLKVLIDRFGDVEGCINNIIMPLFSNVYGKKEEYLFSNLILYILNQNGNNKSNILDSNMVEGNRINENKNIAHKLLLSYFRISKESEVFRKGLYNIVRNLDNMEVECNPSEIYSELYGQSRSLDEALENAKVQEIYERRLGQVRGVIKSIFDFIEKSVVDVPYIVRYFIKLSDSSTFLKDFIYPFLLAGDAFDTKVKITQKLRGKIYKIVDILNWITNSDEIIGKNLRQNKQVKCSINIKKEENCKTDDILIGDLANKNNDSKGEKSIENKNYSELDSSDITSNTIISVYYPIMDSLRGISKRYQNILNTLMNVSTLDDYFQLESINELVRVKKSVIYLSVRVVNEIIRCLKYNITSLDGELISHVDNVDILPDNKNVILSVSLLKSDWANKTNEEEVALENYIKSVKKKLIYLIKCTEGRNIMELLLKDSTPEEIENFEREKCTPDSLDEYKEGLVDDFKFLEEKGVVSTYNLYFEMLTLLADDIFLLKFMSYERSKELKVNELTFSNLLSKEEYLDMKTREYDDYIEEYAHTMVVKNYVYDPSNPVVILQKESKYGSYYYTLEDIQKKGILNEIYDVPNSGDIFFILMSESPLIFALEIYINKMQIANPYSFRFEDMLIMKKGKKEVFDVLGICSFNTDKFIGLLNDRYIKR